MKKTEKKENKIVKFVDEHHFEIVQGTIMLAGAIGLCIIFNKYGDKKPDVKLDKYVDRLVKIKNTDKVIELSENSKEIIGIIDPIKLGDLGKLAETFAEETGLTMDNTVGIMIGYKKAIE